MPRSQARPPASHAVTRPYATTMNLNGRRHPLTGRLVHVGGTPTGTARASEDSWRQLLVFVDRHLRDLAAGAF
jgi:bile acid acyltransferase/acyl-CoA thioester hydrolase-like protein